MKFSLAEVQALMACVKVYERPEQYGNPDPGVLKAATRALRKILKGDSPTQPLLDKKPVGGVFDPSTLPRTNKSTLDYPDRGTTPVIS
jgi:hypothetical protein